MVRYLTILFLLVASVQGNAQEAFQRTGIVRVQGTLAFGFMNNSVKNLYVHGDLGYFLNERLSVRGDTYYFIGNISDTSKFNKNHNVFAGAFYHLNENNQFDPYIGFQPGIAYSQLSDYSEINPNLPASAFPATFNPVFAGIVGFNYFGSKWFHLFINARLIKGKHLSDVSPRYLDELRLSFGLGFNIGVKK